MDTNFIKMKIKVDLTGQNIEDSTVSFYDSKTIFFDATTLLPNTVSFKVWGAGIMPDFDWLKYIDFEKESNIKLIQQQAPHSEITIKGFGVLTFTEVVAGKISIWPYDGKEFLKDSKGKNVEFKREWTLEEIDNNCREYWLDTKIYFPYGACDLRLYAKGEANFEFDTEDCVNYVDYITNPNKEETFLGYLKDNALTTNSF